MASLSLPLAQAAFTFGWSAQGDIVGTLNPHANCNRGEGSIQCASGGSADPDQTPFLQERVLGDDGQPYYHTLIGLPGDDFLQETYIRRGLGGAWQNDGAGTSSGGVNFQGNNRPLDPDPTLSGNATANPTRVLVRQVNSDGEFFQEFFKDTLANKPKIDQTLTTADMTATFSVDMRGLALSDMITGVNSIINTLSLTGGDAPAGLAGNFDYATDVQQPHLTAGKYRWISGSGPDNSSGSWQYSEGDFNPDAVDWAAFRDDSENWPAK